MIAHAIEIERPAGRVFDFVSTPALWHRWHPATRSVREVPERPLTRGEHMVEQIAAAGRHFDARWVVEVCEAPAVWVISTDTPRGGARKRYRITPLGASACRFERSLDFHSKGWFWRALDGSVTRWVLMRQSARALRNLKRVLEAA